MKNIFCKQTIIWLLAIVSLASFGMPARAGDNGPLKTPQASPPDVKSHKTSEVTNWGPANEVSEVNYNQLPVGEVAKNMKQMFKNEFDILLPPGGQGGNLDYNNCFIDLNLKNVTAAEIFNAINLVFQAGNTPFRWELITNGHRPTALLRPLAENPDTPAIDPTTGLPMSSPVRPPEKPMVFFVGDLLGDPRDGFMTMDDVLGTVTDLCRSSNVPASVSGHQGAELIVARGTENDLKFVQDTLTALRQKVKLDTERRAEAKAEKAKTNATSKP